MSNNGVKSPDTDPKNITKIFYLYYRVNGRKQKYKIGKFSEIEVIAAQMSFFTR